MTLSVALASAREDDGWALTRRTSNNDLAVERKANAKLGLVLAEGLLVPAGKDRAVL